MPPWWSMAADVAMHPSTAGLVGSLMSMKLAGPTRGEKLFCALSGIVCAIYALPALFDLMGVHLATVRTLLGLVSGLLGMHVLVRTVEWGKTADWPEIAAAASNFFTVLRGKKPS
jgi:hypothetical protein